MHFKPADWLTNLARPKPKSAWPWRHSIRMAIAVTLPLTIGFLTGHAEAAMMASLGGMLNSIRIQTEPYGIRLRNFFIAIPIQLSGFVLGALVAGHGPLTLLLLVLVGILSGLISGYGAVFSSAAMQMLILAIIAGHFTSSLLGPALLFAAGGLLAALLVAIEAAFDRSYPERLTLAHLLRSLAHLARAAADPASSKPDEPNRATPFELQRRHVTDAMLKAYSGLIETRMRNEGQTSHGADHASILATTGMIFSELVAGGTPPDTLRQVGHRLDQIAYAVTKGRPRPTWDDELDGTGLPELLQHLIDEIWPDTAGPIVPSFPRAHGVKPSLVARLHAVTLASIGRLAPGHDVVYSALKLALCLALAFAAQKLVVGERSYWIPLTVVIVLKPDFGSVFVRAVERSVGTILGVMVGVVILSLVPKGPWLLVWIAALGFLLPAAGQRSYALQCTFLTPLILILIDFTVPGAGNVDYGPQRLVDTLIGAGIALVFGYLIWPRHPAQQILQSFGSALSAAGAYFRAACLPPDAGDPANSDQTPDVFAAATAAYRNLSNVRTALQRAIAEPPPASREAAAWYPAVVEAERLCDSITRLAELNRTGSVTLDRAAVERRLAQLDALTTAAPAGAEKQPGDPLKPRADGDAAFQEIDFELARLSQLMQSAP